MRKFLFQTTLIVFLLTSSRCMPGSAATPSPSAYQELILADEPVLYWSFDPAEDNAIPNLAGEEAAIDLSRKVGKVNIVPAGPDRSNSQLFPLKNSALEIPGKVGYLRISDPGDNSLLDFQQGETITLEAWVNLNSITENQQVYVVGKGRTGNKGFASENQNYALRLRGISGKACVSFLFRAAGVQPGQGTEYFRWNSMLGFAPGSGWHHVMVTYQFGKKADPIAWIDGIRTGGTWDMGSQTERPPVVDNDELWIGSSMGGTASSTLNGQIDEIAVYRKAISEDRIRLRSLGLPPAPPLAEEAAPLDRVLVRIYENVPDQKSWNAKLGAASETYSLPRFALLELPKKYSDRGVQIDWSNPVIVHAASRIHTPAGKQRVLIRARNGARLFIDGKQVLTSQFHNISSSAHGSIRHVAKVEDPHIRHLQTGDNEAVTEYEFTEGIHEFRLELFLGGGKKRLELGETTVSLAAPGKDFQVLGFGEPWFLTEESWEQFLVHDRLFMEQLNAERRHIAGTRERDYWAKRHHQVRKLISENPAPEVPALPQGFTANNPIDQFIATKLAEEKLQPTEPLTDWAFLRRVTLDVLGTVPTAEQAMQFFQDQHPDRRARFIDRLLNDRGWADHWVGYWQDVLAENPNIINPTLNNTGPFRWWIYESFLDNKPLDRFASELVMMQGSEYFGGPGGFRMATQNDSPMSAKAHIISQAFLGVEMKCARCHDAPFHDLGQRDLFSIAAMLHRGPQSVPKSSSLPVDENGSTSLIVQVTVKPGEPIEPAWPFPEISPEDLPPGFVRQSGDTREVLAGLITSPSNERFPRVIVNRLWKQYLGWGLVEPVDDWEHADPSHPELLDWLSRELVMSGYDLKHVARLILNSQVYQRQVATEGLPSEGDQFLFAGPLRRRMSAEQVVDSLFLISGKLMKAGVLNIDADGSREFTSSLNLGRPVRAWEFTSLSNERDRPSLDLPEAQPFVTTLDIFGWRASRQNPVTVRDNTPTVLQPAILANGILGRRLIVLSADSALTELALQDQTVDQLIEQVFIRMLTRKPTEDELATFRELLLPRYEERIVPGISPTDLPIFRPRSTLVSWSNHLSPEANEAKIRLQQLVEKGDPPTPQLQADWRERMEDMLWALMVTPEFVFVP